MRTGWPTILRDEPRFALLAGGQVLSVLGDRVMLVVLPFAVLAVGGGLAAVSLVVAAQTLPFLVLSLVGGVIADRADRRRVMIACDAVRAAVQATAAVLLAAGAATPLLLGALAALYGAVDAFFQPALTGLVPQTLTSVAQLQPAGALRGLTFSIGSLLGPALAAGLVALHPRPPWPAFAFDAVSFVVSIAFLSRLRPHEADLVAAVETRDQPPAGGFLAQLRHGGRAVASRPWVGAYLAALGVYAVIVLPSVYVLGPVLADRELGGASAWALISFAFGVGSVCGDLVLLRWRPRFALRAGAAALMLASCQAVVFGSGLPLGAIVLLELLAGVGPGWCFGLWEISLAEHVPTADLSRVTSYDYLVTGGLAPAGVLLAAPAADAFGLHAVLHAMTVIGVAAGAAALAVPAVRNLPRGGRETASAPR